MSQQGQRIRRKTRNVNKTKQNTNSNNNDMKVDEQVTKTISTGIVIEKEENFQDPNQTKQTPPTHVEDEQQSTVSIKQRNKHKISVNVSSEKEEPVIPSKPQANVALVKQAPLTPLTNDSSNNFKSHQDHNVKTNGYSSSSYNTYTYSAYNPLPPRFQQQQQERQRYHRETTYNNHRYRRRRGRAGRSKRSSFPPDSAARPNDFIPSALREQQSEQQTEDHQVAPDVHFVQQQDLSMTNGYSSESDILTDAPSMAGNTSISPILSTSTGSQSSSLQRLDLVRSLATSHVLLDELIAIFDTISFSSEELELILNKIATKHILDKHDLQRLISTTKSDKTFERIIDETYRSQAKILAIELQTEKNRTLELTRSNADMENTIRQLLQQQQQPNTMIQHQQMMLSYQMNFRRLADENAQLKHQLNAYAMMPATLNELKQQHMILNEQVRQMTIRNSALENEAAKSEQASKHAAEIYKKADAQKQERIEQMIADINKYKKLDRELTDLRQKHTDLEKNSNDKIADMTNQRDQLQTQCNELKDKVQEYEQRKLKYDQLKQNSTNHIEQKLNHLEINNDQSRQSNWKNMQELTNLLNEQQAS